MKIFRILAVILVVVMVLGVFVGCSNDKKEIDETTILEMESETVLEAYYPVTITDSLGTVVTIEEEPMKVISVAPSITEIIFALGIGDKLIGKTSYCNYPPEASDIEAIGTLKEPNIELIVSLEPDVVIAAAHFPEEAQKKLEELGIKVLVLYGEESFEGVYESIQKAAKVFNVTSAGEEIINGMKDKVTKAENIVASLTDKKTVYYALSAGKSDYTATGDTFISDMIEMAGGINIAKEATGWGYNKELLLEKDPNVIIASDYVKAEEFINMEPYKDLTASKKGKVYDMTSADLINIAGPRLADGLLELVSLIYPELSK